MPLIHQMHKNNYVFVNAKQQVILTVHRCLLTNLSQDEYTFKHHDDIIAIKAQPGVNNHSLTVEVNKQQVLHFSDETPESEACLSIYNNLPSFITLTSQKNLAKYRWKIADYRECLTKHAYYVENKTGQSTNSPCEICSHTSIFNISNSETNER